MAQYNVYCILKDVVISVSCVSATDVLVDFGISFQHICVSCMYVRYVLCNFLNGFIILVNVRSVILFNIYLGDTGMIVPLRSILCIIWPSGLILGNITFIHVVYVFRVL